MVDALGAAADPAASPFQVNNRKLIQGFYRGLGIDDVTDAIRVIDKLDKLPADEVAATARRAGRHDAGAGAALPRARHDPRRRTPRSSSRSARSASATSCSTRGSTSSPPWSRAARRRRRPGRASRPTCASRAASTTTPAPSSRSSWTATSGSKSVGGGGRYDALASDGRTTYPGVGVSLRRLPHARPAARRRRAVRQPPGAERRPGRAHRRGRPRRQRRGRRPRCAPAASPARSPPRPRSSASRSATPSGAASRTSGSSRRRRRATEVKDIRSRRAGAGRPGHLDPAEPRTCDPQHQHRHQRHRGEPVIRTHDAGALRAEHVGQTVTLAGWVARRRDHGGVAFLDLREASGVVQVVVRDEEVAHSLRSEYCLKVTGEVVARKAEGNANPNLATGEIEVVADRASRCSAPPRRCRSRSTTPPQGGEVGEEARLKHRYLDLRRTGPNAALRLRSKVNKAARDVLDAPRLRRDRDADADPVHARGRPRLPGAGPAAARQLVRPAAEPAAVQAAADGRRHGALLPDRALLPRRGLPRRPAARVHPARHRDELRRPGRRASRSMEDVLVAMWALVGHDVSTPAAADDVRRRDGALRLRQARPADGPRARRVHRLLQGHHRSGCSRRLRRRRRDARAAAASRASSSTPGRTGPSSAAPRAWPTSCRRGRRARRTGRQEPHRRRARRASPPTSAPSRATASSSPPDRSRAAVRCSAPRASRSVAAAACSTSSPGASPGSSTRPLFEPAADAAASGDVAVGAGAWTAVHHAFTSPKPSSSTPSTPTPAARWPTPTTSSATATRSAAGRSVSTARTSRSASSR